MSRDFSGADANHLGVTDGNAPALSFTGLPITISAWIRPDNVGAQKGIVTKWGTTGGQRSWALEVNATGAAAFGTADGTNNSFAVGATALSTAGVWQHVCGRQTADDVYIYLDGVQDGINVTQRTIPNTVSSIFVGRYGAAGFPFDGLIAEVAIWSATLLPEEIAALSMGMNPRLIRPQNLRVYWPLLGTGSPEPDYSGRDGHIPLAGSVPAGVGHPPVIPFVPMSISALPTVEVVGFFDSATVPITLTVSSAELEDSIDVAEVYVDLTPSGVDELTGGGVNYTDSDTILVDLSVTSTESFDPVEVATAYVDITPSGVDIRETTDSDTVLIDIQPSGQDLFAPLVPWWDPLPDAIRTWFEITPRKWETQTATRFRVTVRGRI